MYWSEFCILECTEVYFVFWSAFSVLECILCSGVYFVLECILFWSAFSVLDCIEVYFVFWRYILCLWSVLKCILPVATVF